MKPATQALFLAAALPVIAGHIWASDLDEFKVKREAVFEFLQKPQVTREGDRVTITFETKAFCDVTVAIEGESMLAGSPRIIRHLACGVLGRTRRRRSRRTRSSR